MNLEAKALAYATEAHKGQVRKYTAEPYINHPIVVATIVKMVPHTEEMVAAALLHDVVEDCGVPLRRIKRKFGCYVAYLVEQLTDVSTPADGPREARKAIDLAHTAACWPMAATIKLADLLDNSRTILTRDPDFARVYIREKARTLLVLKHGDPMLWGMADRIVRTAKQRMQIAD